MVPPTFNYGIGRVKVLKVLDGDTVELEIDLGFGDFHREAFRIQGIDAPEIRGKTKEAGLAAKAALTEFLGDGSMVSVETIKAPSKDKYGRYLADPFVAGSGFASEYMIENGFAKPYNGGAR